eukprot:TRINITY_DN70_c0_g1_i3.p1 TRINITY_DN70_c0_g1~~TRINITY_DN70_c0_g1_i3.p1  ORF type:complete len:360 (-),score=123.87 TRINITY_DN70_c0_g1_i3:147-1097(-)
MSVEDIKGPGANPWDINFDDLEDISEIGGGNFGKVYKGVYFGVDVAIKQLLDVDDEFMHKFIEREMAVLKGIRHPNVVQFLGLSKSSDGNIFIITEFIPGGDLRKILKNKSIPLGWKLRVKIAIDVASAMSFLHSKGIIHRDLKSNNLLVGENFKVKVCDFGFARDIDSSECMTLCGTDEWMAPEVMLGEKYNEKADVFSYGMVLVELITRKKPPKRLPGKAFAYEPEKLKQEAPPQCPPGFIEIVNECSVWDPDKRPSLKEVLPKLKALEKTLPEDEGEKSSEQMSNTMDGIIVVEEGSDDSEEEEEEEEGSGSK